MTIRGRLLRASTLLAAFALVAGMAGCGNAQVPVTSTDASRVSTSSSGAPSSASAGAGSATAGDASSASAATGAGSAAPATETQTVDGKEIAGLPAGFPFPADAKVDFFVAGSMIELEAPSRAVLADFYRSELSKAGFTLDFDSGGDTPALLFSSAGWAGQIAVNSTGGANITWGVPEQDTATTATDPQESDKTAVDLGLTNVDFFLRFPPATTLTDITDSPTGTSFTFTAPKPADVLGYYREHIKSVHFTRDSDTTTDGSTTLTWHTDETTMVLTVSADSAAMTSTPR